MGLVDPLAAFLPSALPTLPARDVLGDLESPPVFFKPLGSEVLRGMSDRLGESLAGESLQNGTFLTIAIVRNLYMSFGN